MYSYTRAPGAQKSAAMSTRSVNARVTYHVKLGSIFSKPHFKPFKLVNRRHDENQDGLLDSRVERRRDAGGNKNDYVVLVSSRSAESGSRLLVVWTEFYILTWYVARTFLRAIMFA
jgi:hypothetical protein